jgi:hypothetical protein
MAGLVGVSGLIINRMRGHLPGFYDDTGDDPFLSKVHVLVFPFHRMASLQP